MKREWMSFITHIRNAVSASSAKEKIALNLFPACAIWMKEIIGTWVENYTEQRRLGRGMSAAIFM